MKKLSVEGRAKKLVYRWLKAVGARIKKIKKMLFTSLKDQWTTAWPYLRKALRYVLKNPMAFWILRKAIFALYKWSKEEDNLIIPV